MEAHNLWKLFLQTGLPEAYSLYRLLIRAEQEENSVNNGADRRVRPGTVHRECKYAYQRQGPGAAGGGL